ncbi:MAG: Crp/Fnr family transcriptional regulator [Pseudomonadota bacterium]
MGELPAWVDAFPELRDIEDPVWVDVANYATEAVLPPGSEVFHEGDVCRNYIFVLEGATRVYKAFESGREMVLYRVQAGETCSITTSVLLAGGLYPANAVTETECRAVLIPANDFHKVFDTCKGFRDYVCTVFGGRIRDLIMLLEAVTMRNVNVRLARWLLDNGSSAGLVEASHRELAFELGTAREVISRHLREFQKNGWVALSRKNIELLDIKALLELVGGYR